MIELFRESESAEADWVEAELREMVVGYARRVTTPQESALTFGDLPLPILQDADKLASGRDGLTQFLRELETFAEAWRLFQGDSCYVRDDGSHC